MSLDRKTYVVDHTVELLQNLADPFVSALRSSQCVEVHTMGDVFFLHHRMYSSLEMKLVPSEAKRCDGNAAFLLPLKTNPPPLL